MKNNTRTGLVLSLALAMGSTAAFGAAVINVNNVCQSATCTPGTLSPGQSDSGSFNFNASVNGDMFNFAGNYLNTLNAAGTVPQENLNLTVTLVSTKSSAGSSLDDINVTDLVDRFVWPYSSDTFFEIGTWSFGGDLASSSQGEEYLTVGTQKLPILGPFGPFSTQTQSYTSGSIDTTGENPLSLTLTDVMEFGAGSFAGAYEKEGLASVPEPGYLVPLAGVLLALTIVQLRRRGLLRADRSSVLK